ncbi:MAG: hypothetical protein HY769_04090 [Candidatus Stahlbacteria bacterium]|nr:hypothetical protein [Candidatus Stahlbacteria bacterium]
MNGLIWYLILSNLTVDTVRVTSPAKYSNTKYIVELAAGYAIGTIGWCIGANVGNAIWKTDDAIAIGGYSLYGISSSLGVWLTGKQYTQGKYLHTLIGAISLPLTIIGIARMCGKELSPANDIIWVSVPIGAIIGYNLSTAK